MGVAHIILPKVRTTSILMKKCYGIFFLLYTPKLVSTQLLQIFFTTYFFFFCHHFFSKPMTHYKLFVHLRKFIEGISSTKIPKKEYHHKNSYCKDLIILFICFIVFFEVIFMPKTNGTAVLVFTPRNFRSCK